jgi:hypothetical protein
MAGKNSVLRVNNMAEFQELKNRKGIQTKRQERKDYFPAIKMQCTAAKIPLPVQEYKFHPGRQWRNDFCWPDYKLAIEVEGATWLPTGGHSRGSAIVRDMEKYNQLALDGFLLLRYTPKMINDGTMIRDLVIFFKNLNFNNLPF